METPKSETAANKSQVADKSTSGLDIGANLLHFIRLLVGDQSYNYEWTLHCPIKWDVWAERFPVYVANFKDAKLPNLLDIKMIDPHDTKIVGDWPALVIGFFVQRNIERHYGAFELQIVLDGMIRHDRESDCEPQKREEVCCIFLESHNICAFSS